jgi:hypothetical protein
VGKVLFAVCAFLVLCIVGLALVSYLGRDEETLAVDNLLAEDLTRRIQQAEDRDEGQVDLATATDFAWDRVLIVAPDAPKDAIDDALGYPFRGDLNYTAESKELFIFERAGQVRKYADYRGQGTFEGFERPVDERSADAAVLRVRDLVIRPG